MMNFNVFETYNEGMNVTELGWRVRRSREDLGITQSDLAERASISRPYLTNIEKGRVENVGVLHIENLAHNLGVSMEYLLGLSEDPLPAPMMSNEINDAHALYEAVSAQDRPRLQRLVESYQAIDVNFQNVLLDLALTLHDAQVSMDLQKRDMGTMLVELITDRATRKMLEEALHLSHSDPSAARDAIIALAS